MTTRNKYEISTTIDPRSTRIDMGEYARHMLGDQLAKMAMDRVPVEITTHPICTPEGSSMEVHKMTLFIFSEQEMKAHDARTEKMVLFALASERCLYNLPEVPCH